MVLILDGSSEYVAHVFCKNSVETTGVDVPKCLKQVKLPIPHNIRTVQHKNPESYDGFEMITCQ